MLLIAIHSTIRSLGVAAEAAACTVSTSPIHSICLNECFEKSLEAVAAVDWDQLDAVPVDMVPLLMRHLDLVLVPAAEDEIRSAIRSFQVAVRCEVSALEVGAWRA